jgi:hypothetical protein
MNDIIKGINNLHLFSKENEYLILHQVSLLNYEDITDECELLELLNNTFKRYKTYLVNVMLPNDIQEGVKYYIEKYKDYNTSEYVLFNLMKKIDERILYNIHSKSKLEFF